MLTILTLLVYLFLLLTFHTKNDPISSLVFEDYMKSEPTFTDFSVQTYTGYGYSASKNLETYFNKPSIIVVSSKHPSLLFKNMKSNYVAVILKTTKKTDKSGSFRLYLLSCTGFRERVAQLNPRHLEDFTACLTKSCMAMCRTPSYFTQRWAQNPYFVIVTFNR